MEQNALAKIEIQEYEIQKSSAYTEYLLKSLKDGKSSNEHEIYKSGFDAGWNKAISLIKDEISEVLIQRLRKYIIDNVEIITGDEIDYDINHLLDGFIEIKENSL